MIRTALGTLIVVFALSVGLFTEVTKLRTAPTTPAHSAYIDQEDTSEAHVGDDSREVAQLNTVEESKSQPAVASPATAVQMLSDFVRQCAELYGIPNAEEMWSRNGCDRQRAELEEAGRALQALGKL